MRIYKIGTKFRTVLYFGKVSATLRKIAILHPSLIPTGNWHCNCHRADWTVLQYQVSFKFQELFFIIFLLQTIVHIETKLKPSFPKYLTMIIPGSKFSDEHPRLTNQTECSSLQSRDEPGWNKDVIMKQEGAVIC